MVDYKITERPVTGEVNKNSHRVVEQITPAQFLALVDNVLALPKVHSLVWDQYTPYFNDGEECVFSIGDVRVVLEGEEEGYDSDYGVGRTTSELWDQDWRTGVGFVGERTYFAGGVETREIYDALEALDRASGAWEAVARENFGDHAEVTATREGFSVEYYEHD